MAEAFKIGDVVKLKSGGPRMTVTQVGKNTSGEPTVWTAWFDGQKKDDGYYPANAVELA